MASPTLVGSLGAVSVGATGAAVTPAWGASSSQTLGNLLVCWTAVQGNAQTVPGTPTGWTAMSNRNGSNVQAVINFWKIAVGGDAAPTITPTAGQIATVQIAEFDCGLVLPPGAGLTDRGGGASATSGTSITAAASNLDHNPGQLVLYTAGAIYTVGAAVTLSHAANNGVTVTATDNNSTVTANHYSFGYGTTTSNAANDNDVLTYSSTTLTYVGLVLNSLKLFDLTPPVLRRNAYLAM